MHFNTHVDWMSVALETAKKNQNEVPVCSLIIKDNKLISKGTNQTEFLKDSTAHAEIIAIKGAAKALDNWRLEGCVLYTTLEPCSMCAGAIINSRINKIVFGAYDLNLGACGSAINLFKELNKQNQFEVIGGVLEIEAAKLIKDFFSKKRSKIKLS